MLEAYIASTCAPQRPSTRSTAALKAAGVTPADLESFHCPIGLDLGSSLPGEIAISIAAQLLQCRDAWRKSTADSDLP